MRKSRGVRRFVLLFILTGILLSLHGCYKAREKEYYSDKSNYISGKAVVDNIIFDEDTHSIYFWLSEIDEDYQDSTFVVEGESVDVLIGCGVFERVKSGSVIIFVSAPYYFGDGYCMPMVALSCDDETLLSFEVGYENLLRLY